MKTSAKSDAPRRERAPDLDRSRKKDSPQHGAPSPLTATHDELPDLDALLLGPSLLDRCLAVVDR